MKSSKKLNRREFISKMTSGAVGLTIIPSYVMGLNGKISPNDKINVALIGCGTQALRQLPDWLKREELQFVAVCDPNKESYDYPLWGKPQGEKQGAPGGREIGRKRINDFYAEKIGANVYDSCTTYADFRELLEKENDLDAIFIMTPDHLHATIALTAMKKNVCVATHKPISNFMNETRLACNAAKKTGVATHCFAFQDPEELYQLKAWIDNDLIGEIKELHRWTNRPMWPQGSPYLPEEEPIPEGFDWQLWLGPSTNRPYSSAYTHTVFRGWYEFGGGCLADMGYYGFWKDWRILNLGIPTNAEGAKSFTCEIRDFRSAKVENNVSYPHAATIKWADVPVIDKTTTVDVFWYEGGIKPATPKSLVEKGMKMPEEGVMFVGDRGTILADYDYGNITVLNVRDGAKRMGSIEICKPLNIDQTTEMIRAFRGGSPSRGRFQEVQSVAEAICLGNLAIRMDDRLEWDSENMQVANHSQANEFVSRIYRKGWEL